MSRRRLGPSRPFSAPPAQLPVRSAGASPTHPRVPAPRARPISAPPGPGPPRSLAAAAAARRRATTVSFMFKRVPVWSFRRSLVPGPPAGTHRLAYQYFTTLCQLRLSSSSCSSGFRVDPSPPSESFFRDPTGQESAATPQRDLLAHGHADNL
jgi:hypothetical protein